MDAIQCGDASLQAAIAHIKSQSDNPEGLGSNFEEAAAYLLQFCPVSKKRKAQPNDRPHNVSSVGFHGEEGRKKSKPNKGETGVELRYYKPKEYRKLSSEQMEELQKWRKDNGLVKDSKKGKPKANMKEQIVAAIKEISKERETQENENSMIRNFLISVAKEEKVDGATEAKSNNKSGDSAKKVDFDESTINANVKRLK